MIDVTAHFGLRGGLPHHALEDALIQAELFRRILAEGASRRSAKELAT